MFQIHRTKAGPSALGTDEEGRGMRQVSVTVEEDGSKLEYLTFPMLERTGIVKHLFTTRLGGVSRGEFSSMNLSFTRGDREEDVHANYRRIAKVMGCEPGDMTASHQTHTTNIRRVTREDRGKGIVRERDYEEIDGLVTNEPGIVLVTYFADCVPLYFVDPSDWRIRAGGGPPTGWESAWYTPWNKISQPGRRICMPPSALPSAGTAMRSAGMLRCSLRRNRGAAWCRRERSRGNISWIYGWRTD